MANTDLILTLPSIESKPRMVYSAITAWAFDPWAVVAKKTMSDINIIGFTFQWTHIPAVDSTVECLFEIGIGDLGGFVTKVQLPFNIRSDTAVGIYLNTANNLFLPEGYTVPSGSSIAVRVADSITGSLLYNGVSLICQATATTAIPPAPAYSNNYQRGSGGTATNIGGV